MQTMKKLLLILVFLYVPCALAMTQPKIKNVLFIVAMQKEAQPLIKSLKLHPMNTFHHMPMKAYSGKYKNLNITLVWNGKDPVYKVDNVGTEAAAITTYAALEKFHPDLVVSVGTAGAVAAKHIQPGTVLISKKIFFYDRRIPGEHKKYGIGDYSSYALKSFATFKKGIICTGDNFEQTPTDYAMFLKLNCDAIEMEAASVAWVSLLNHTPMIAVKGVTNNVEGKNASAVFHKNFVMTTTKLTQDVKQLLDALQK